MSSIPTNVRRRLDRLRRRSERVRKDRQYVQSNTRYRYDACLRLAGLGAAQDQIALTTGLRATHTHRKGEPFGLRGNTRPTDMWMLASPLGEAANHSDHLEWLWQQVGPHAEYFRILVQEAAWADVCLGCLSESPCPLISVAPESLTLLRELELGLSFNFTLV